MVESPVMCRKSSHQMLHSNSPQSRSGNGNTATAFTGVTTNVSGVVTTVTRNSSAEWGNVTQVSGIHSSDRNGTVTVRLWDGEGMRKLLPYQSAAEVGREQKWPWPARF